MKPARVCAWCGSFASWWDVLKGFLWPKNATHTICSDCTIRYMGDT